MIVTFYIREFNYFREDSSKIATSVSRKVLKTMITESNI